MESKSQYKLLIISYLLLFLSACKLPLNEVRKTKFKIESIDSTTLNTAYLIHAKAKNKHIFIYSKRQLEYPINCDLLIIDKRYKLNLKKIYSLELDTIRFRLYQHNLYVNDKLIIRKGTLIFESEDIKGLCVIR